MEPLFEHDCELCVYLGQYEGEDLYVHPRSKNWVEGIHRTGARPWEYGAMPLPQKFPIYQEIERRCREFGIVVPDDNTKRY